MTFQNVIDIAVAQAKFSDCAKSRRGVVVFDEDFSILGADYNGQPRTGMHPDDEPLRCPRTELCRASCRYTAVHAEIRALRQVDWSQATWEVQLLHVKVDDAGQLVAGGPPSCVQCSKEILDCGRVSRVWLYERMAIMCEHERETVECTQCPTGSWCSYSPLTFHKLSLQNSLKDKNPHA